MSACTPGPSSLSRRNVLLTGAAAAAASLSMPAIARTMKIRYTLSWLPTGQYAFVYMAQQLGFWKRRGLDVDVSRGYGSMAAIEGIAAGKFEMGGAATGAVILSKARGIDLQMIGTQGYNASLGILVPASGPIRTPKDLAGKTIGVTAAGGDTPFLPAYCQLAGIDFKSLKVIALDSQIIEQSVMNGRVDCMIAFAMSSIPNFVTQNFPVRLLPFSQVGLNFYWVNTLVGAALMKKEPQMVSELEAGLMDGLKWSMLNPDEAVERHLKSHPEIAISKNGKLFTELGVGMVAAINVVPDTEKHGLGYTAPHNIDEQSELVKKYVLKPTDHAPPPADGYVFNLPKTGATLTPAEWQKVRQANAKYLTMLGIA